MAKLFGTELLLKNVKDDENCFYRAYAIAIGKKEEDYKEVKNALAKYLNTLEETPRRDEGNKITINSLKTFLSSFSDIDFSKADVARPKEEDNFSVYKDAFVALAQKEFVWGNSELLQFLNHIYKKRIIAVSESGDYQSGEEEINGMIYGNGAHYQNVLNYKDIDRVGKITHSKARAANPANPSPANPSPANPANPANPASPDPANPANPANPDLVKPLQTDSLESAKEEDKSEKENVDTKARISPSGIITMFLFTIFTIISATTIGIPIIYTLAIGVVGLAISAVVIGGQATVNKVPVEGRGREKFEGKGQENYVEGASVERAGDRNKGRGT